MDAILALNAGSSSIKFGLYNSSSLDLLARGLIDRGCAPSTFTASGALSHRLPGTVIPEDLHSAELIIWLTENLLRSLPDISLKAVGHRIVHGGPDLTHPVRLDADVLAKLAGYSSFAPAHQPLNLAGVEAISQSLPGVLQIGCFDTAFHRTIPRLAQLFPIPRALTESGLLRYGFHGLSYQHIAETLPTLLYGRTPSRAIAAHLGNGASLCAMKDGRSIATTMGLTALDGLMMGARSGAVDPGLILHLIEQKGIAPAEVNRLLNRQSGLLGVSGLSADVRILETSQDPAAREALDLFAYRAAREVGSLSVALRGLDALVFAGGIGEHSASMRSRICAHLEHLGVAIDPSRNNAHEPRIAANDSAVQVLVIPANEELPIARAAKAFLALD